MTKLNTPMVPFAVRVPEQMDEILETVSVTTGMSVSSMVRIALNEFLIGHADEFKQETKERLAKRAQEHEAAVRSLDTIIPRFIEAGFSSKSK